MNQFEQRTNNSSKNYTNFATKRNENIKIYQKLDNHIIQTNYNDKENPKTLNQQGKIANINEEEKKV